MPIPEREWREPSQAQFKDQFGNPGTQTRFRLRGLLNDGFVKWCGWFDDRADLDAFLFALFTGSIVYERELWRLPTPHWHPDIGEGLSYEFASVTFLTTTGSNQTHTSASDWNNANNSIELLGGGGGGARSGAGHATGGGGGSYSEITNFIFATPGTTTATYRVAASVAGISASNPGTNGNPSWFNNATDPGAGSDNTKAGAKGGTGGPGGTGNQSGGAGGVTATSWGQTLSAGGRGGNLSGASGTGGSGGGGSAGLNGAGGNAADSTSTGSGVSTAGGSADNGTTAGANAGANNGGSGTEWDGSHGSGSGGGGNGGGNGGTGGNYGGGGGGSLGATSGGGAQGLIVVTYTLATKGIPGFTSRRIFFSRRK